MPAFAVRAPSLSSTYEPLFEAHFGVVIGRDVRVAFAVASRVVRRRRREARPRLVVGAVVRVVWVAASAVDLFDHAIRNLSSIIGSGERPDFHVVQAGVRHAPSGSHDQQ